MGIHPDLLKNHVFADSPANWFIHAQGFYNAGLKLFEAKAPGPKKKFLSTEDGFLNAYSYKIAVYLLAHAIELALKTIISSYNLSNQNNKLKPPVKYSHKVTKMVGDLIEVRVLSLSPEDHETMRLVEEYLSWFGRYYCPHPKDTEETLKQSYTNPDENGLINFKYKLDYTHTHKKLIKLYDELRHPSAEKANLTMQYLLHTP